MQHDQLLLIMLQTRAVSIRIFQDLAATFIGAKLQNATN